jgi:hypothetical protein
MSNKVDRLQERLDRAYSKDDGSMNLVMFDILIELIKSKCQLIYWRLKYRWSK